VQIAKNVTRLSLDLSPSSLMESPLSALFSTVGLAYGLMLPVVLMQLLAILFIASLLRPGSSTRSVARATYCYLMMGVGILLMTTAALPTTASVLAGASYSPATYVALLVLFGAGGLVYLWHEQWAHTIDGASSAVPSLIFFYVFKIAGILATLLAALSVILTLILGGGSDSGWWVLPLSIFFYGLILSWCTRAERAPRSLFRSNPLMAGMSMANAARSAATGAVKKKAPKRKR
jgi:hypothetical protein